MTGHDRDEMTRLGYYGVIPFIASAAAVWMSPLILPQHIATDFHQFTLIYSGVVIAYLSGIGAGAMIPSGGGRQQSFVPGILVVLAAFFAILPYGVFVISIDGVWQHLIILLLLVYLLIRDLNGVRAGILPAWYGELRTRLTMWAGLSIVLIMARLFLWGFY